MRNKLFLIFFVFIIISIFNYFYFKIKQLNYEIYKLETIHSDANAIFLNRSNEIENNIVLKNNKLVIENVKLQEEVNLLKEKYYKNDNKISSIENNVKSLSIHVKSYENKIQSSIKQDIDKKFVKKIQYRAIAVFLESGLRYLREIRWLHESWSYVLSNNTKIDLLIFYEGKTVNSLPSEWQCVDAEDRNRDKNNCVVTQVDFNNTRVVTKYKFLKSIDFINHQEAQFLGEYDLILKTDCDTFITPAFVNWYPRVFHTGVGGYAHSQIVKKKLLYWAKKLNLKHNGKFNLGATWYGDSKIIKKLARLATDLNVHLMENAFLNKSEDNWPHWFSGVSSMYAQELAVNHLVPELEITHKMDYPSDKDGNINDVYHIHCFHSPGMFNKFEFQHGYYDHFNTSKWDLTKVNHWALEMALRGNFPQKEKSVIQLYPPQQLVKPNYKYLIESKNNYFLSYEDSNVFSHINTDIEHHENYIAPNVLKKDGFFWSYFSPKKNGKFIFFPRVALETPCSIRIITGIRDSKGIVKDNLKDGTLMVSFENKTFNSQISANFDNNDGMANIIVYPGKKIYQIGMFVNQMQNEWLRIIDIKTKFDFTKIFSLSIFVNNTIQKNSKFDNLAKNILDGDITTHFEIKPEYKIHSFGIKSKMKLDNCTICFKTENLKYEQSNDIIFGMDDYGLFHGQHNQVYESNNFFCFMKQMPDNSFSLNILENESRKNFKICSIFVQGSCMRDFN